MKFVPLFLALGLCACQLKTHVKVTTPHQRVIDIKPGPTLGGREEVYVVTDGVTVEYYRSHERSFQDGSKTVRQGFWAHTVGRIGDSLIGAWKSIAN